MHKVFSEDGTVNIGGSIDAGCPKQVGVCQPMLMPPKGVDWKGLCFKVEIEIKGQFYPVAIACQQKTYADGSLTLQPNLLSILFLGRNKSVNSNIHFLSLVKAALFFQLFPAFITCPNFDKECNNGIGNS